MYALVLTMAGLLLSIIWFHARRNHLITNGLIQTEMQSISLQTIIPPVVFAISMLISVVNIQVAYYFWIIIIPVKIIIHKKYPE